LFGILRTFTFIPMQCVSPFKLQHVQGKTFAADGLSRRDAQPGDEGIKEKIDKDKNDLECSKEQKDFLRTFVVAPLIHDLKERYTELLAENEYPEEGCSFVGKSQDEWLLLVRGWLKNPVQRPEGLMDKQYVSFMRFAKGFFVDKENRLYRRNIDSCHKLVVDKSHRMYMM